MVDRLAEIKARWRDKMHGSLADDSQLADTAWLISEVERLRENLEERERPKGPPAD